MYNNFYTLTIYTAGYGTLLVIEMDFSSVILDAELLLSLCSRISLGVRSRSGFDVESSFFSPYGLRGTPSFAFPSFPPLSRVVVKRNISFAWLIVYLNENYKDIKRGAEVHGIIVLKAFYITTLIMLLPHGALEVWVPCFSTRAVIRYLGLPRNPTPPTIGYPRCATDRFYERVPVLHAHQII